MQPHLNLLLTTHCVSHMIKLNIKCIELSKTAPFCRRGRHKANIPNDTATVTITKASKATYLGATAIVYCFVIYKHHYRNLTTRIQGPHCLFPTSIHSEVHGPTLGAQQSAVNYSTDREKRD